MKPTPNYAGRGLVLAWVGNVLIAAMAGMRIHAGAAFGAFTLLCAWLTGFLFYRAVIVDRERRELERRKAAAEAYALELAQLEQSLADAPSDEARVRLLERLAGFETLALALVLLVGCGDAPAVEDLDAGDDAAPLELEHDAQAELEHDAGDAGDVDWLALVHPHCAGAWADREDSSTRFVAHPDTGLCTFACRWLEPKCEEPWYGDPRCFPAHEQRLEQVCASIGGTCELASDGERYCEAAQ